MTTLPKPAWELSYNGRNIGPELQSWVRSITYTDHLHARADELSVSVDNSDGRWFDSWYPGKRDLLSLRFGYSHGSLIDAGEFRIDSLGLGGRETGDTVTIKALSATTADALRTRSTREFEEVTLADIVAEIAAAHGLTVSGTIEPLMFERRTQRDQEDLAFLQQLADEFGYAVNVRGSALTFERLETLVAAPSVATLAREGLASYAIQDVTKGVYEAAEISYQPPGSKEPIIVRVDAAGADLAAITSADVLRREANVENEAQARAMGRAILLHENRKQRTGRLSLVGNPLLVAGAHIDLPWLGALAGKWQLTKSTHSMSDNGYATSAEIVHV